MRIAYVFMRFPLPSETFASRDIKALREKGADVEVYTLRAPHAEAEALIRERKLAGIPIQHGTVGAAACGLAYGVRHPGILSDLLRWIVRTNVHQPIHLINGCWFAPVAVEIFRQIAEDPPEVVHLFWGHYPAMVGYMLKKHRPEIPLSMFLGAYDISQRFGGTPPVLQRANCVWTHAKENVSDVAALGNLAEEHVQVVPRGIELTMIDRALEHASRISGRIVTTSRLIKAKGVDDVLRCVSEVRRARPDVELVVLGDGPARGDLERLAEQLGLADAVTFRGHVSEQEVAQEVAQADLFVILSRKQSERLPNALKEAMAAGCICITSSTPGIGELLEDRRTGYIVPQGSPYLAATRVREVLNAPHRHDAMRDAARQVIRERFEVGGCMSRYLEAWQAIIRTGAQALPESDRVR